MIGAIVRKEIREIARDGRFRVAAITVLVLLVAALAVGWRAAASAHAERDAAANLARSHWVNQPAKNPHSAAHYGVYAFKPKTPLSFVDDGIDPYTGVLAYLEAHVQNDFTHRPAADGTALSRFGALTAAGVLQVLVPLLIVVLAAGTIAGEREQGTLRQLLSVGARSRDLAIGKMLGLGSALMLLLIPATIIGVAALLVGTDGSGSGSRFLLLAAVYLGYFVVWIALSFAVSAWAPSTRAALICLLGLWMVNSLLAPRAATDLVRRLHPTPTALEFQRVMAAEQQADSTGRTYAEYQEAFQREVLSRYRVDSVADLPVNFAGMSLDASERWSDAVFDRNYGRLWATYVRQDQARSLFGFAFPFVAVRALSQGLAGTDFYHHREFATAAEQYRRHLVRVMNDDLAEHGKTAGFQYMGDHALWSSVEPFEYQTPQVGFVLAHHGRDLAALGGWLVLGLGLALVGARRVRV